MQFIVGTHNTQHVDSLFRAWLSNHYRLEAALQRGVFLDMFAVFIQRCRTDTTQFAARQCRFEHVCCANCALSRARAHDRM